MIAAALHRAADRLCDDVARMVDGVALPDQLPGSRERAQQLATLLKAAGDDRATSLMANAARRLQEAEAMWARLKRGKAVAGDSTRDLNDLVFDAYDSLCWVVAPNQAVAA